MTNARRCGVPSESGANVVAGGPWAASGSLPGDGLAFRKACAFAGKTSHSRRIAGCLRGTFSSDLGYARCPGARYFLARSMCKVQRNRKNMDMKLSRTGQFDQLPWHLGRGRERRSCSKVDRHTEPAVLTPPQPAPACRDTLNTPGRAHTSPPASSARHPRPSLPARR